MEIKSKSFEPSQKNGKETRIEKEETKEETGSFETFEEYLKRMEKEETKEEIKEDEQHSLIGWEIFEEYYCDYEHNKETISEIHDFKENISEVNSDDDNQKYHTLSDSDEPSNIPLYINIREIDDE